jgi:HK97 family phage major capsid protein
MSTLPNTATSQDTNPLADRVTQLRESLAALEADRTKSRGSVPGGAPHARVGEDPLTSRGYSFLKLFGLMSGAIKKENCKVEVDMHERLTRNWFEAYGAMKSEANTILAPLGSALLPRNTRSEVEFADEVQAIVKAGTYGYDPEELRHLSNRVKTLSWQNETAMGSLVAPPQMGELIEVLRNNEVFLQCGARYVPMPANGRYVFPRQTGTGTAYYPGENRPITESEPTTGDVTLQAKKVAAIVKLSNELSRYASISAEAFVREDMSRFLALRMDKELLEGVGSANAPKGIINYNITRHTSLGTPADGNSGFPFQPEDVIQMIAKVEENNATFRSFVMRPLMFAWIANRRADAVSANDAKGPFMFNIVRDIAQDMNVTRTMAAHLSGYPVYKSTQISNARTRGSGSNMSYILGGDFSDFIIAMSPTIEFAMQGVGDTAFASDQTWILAILMHDGAPAREASFVMCDQLRVV